jgi:predicted RNase H-like HicB family nuclease
MRKVNVIIERAKDNTYSAYTDCHDYDFGLLGYGDTVKETIDDFYGVYNEFKEIYAEEGKDFPELEFDFQYDVASFLDYYTGMLSKSGLEKITGINQKQLWQYASGVRRPKPATTRKIQESLYHFADELKQVHFVD